MLSRTSEAPPHEGGGAGGQRPQLSGAAVRAARGRASAPRSEPPTEAGARSGVWFSTPQRPPMMINERREELRRERPSPAGRRRTAFVIALNNHFVTIASEHRGAQRSGRNERQLHKMLI